MTEPPFVDHLPFPNVQRREYRWWQFLAKRHCPHENVRGIFGDEINATPGFRRNECLDCGRRLDGPVSIALHRPSSDVHPVPPRPAPQPPIVPGVSEPWRISVNLTVSGEILVYPPVSIPSPDVVGGSITFTTQKESIMGEITVVADETTLKAVVKFTDSEGNETTPDEVPTWEVGDANVLTVTPSEDGLSATFEVGAPGASSVTVTTSETHGGVGEPTQIILTGLVTAVAGDTVSGSVEFATGSETPPEPPPLVDNSLPEGEDGAPDQTLPGDLPHPDQSLPGSGEAPNQDLPGGESRRGGKR